MGKKIVLTGGGTAGHVTPNMALIPRLRELGYEICYMGSYDGIEKKLMEDFNLPYYGIAVPRDQGNAGSAEIPERDQSGRGLFQRGVCQCARGAGGGFSGDSVYHT